jgi:hypothetical protein
MVLKYYTYVEPDDNDRPVYTTLSEDEIIKEYWNYWYTSLCKRFGKDFVNVNYTKQDCIDDWVIINWAWESEDE